MDSNSERRRFTRVDFVHEAEITQGDYRCEVMIIDISLNGVLIETPDSYALNTDQQVDIVISLSGDIAITLPARLAHSSNRMLGFQNLGIEMESMAHLRRLIELNIEDPGASERVLDELIARTAS